MKDEAQKTPSYCFGILGHPISKLLHSHQQGPYIDTGHPKITGWSPVCSIKLGVLTCQ